MVTRVRNEATSIKMGWKRTNNLMAKTGYVYILASKSKVLYVGVTNYLERRMSEHREGRIRGFTSRYGIFHLVHFEMFADIRDAIAREKVIKKWSREKKIRLIERTNRKWEDLALELQKKEIPHARQKAPIGSE